MSVGEIGARKERQEEKESEEAKVSWREHASWPPVWTHYIFIG